MQLQKKIKVFFLFLGISILSYGQEFQSKNITTNDGLPNNSIYSIFKDSRGILWIGTENGISKSINGKITNYSISDGLAHNSCWAIIEDQNHNLWFGSHGGGITFYNGERFSIINAKNGLVNDKIRRLFLKEQNLYVATENGVSIIDINTKKVIFSKKRKSKINKFQVMDFFVYHSKIFFGTFGDGIWEIDLKRRIIILKPTVQPGVFAIFQKDKNNLLICHGDTRNKSLHQYKVADFLNNKPSKNEFGNTNFWSFAKDNRGIIYSAGNGINFSTGGLFQIKEDKEVNLNNQFGIKSTEIWSLFQDKENDILYVGTLDKGLYSIELKDKIEYFPPSFFKNEEVEIIGFENAFNCNIILEKKGVYFIQNSRIIRKINSAYFFNYMKKHTKNKGFENEFDYVKIFKDSKLNAFEFRALKSADGKLWLSSTIGLFGLNKEGKIIDYYAIDAEAFLNDKKLYYQISYGGTNIIKKNRGKIIDTPIFKNQNKASRNVNINVNSIFRKDKLIFFVSSTHGLITWNSKDFTFLTNKYRFLDKEIVCSKQIRKNKLLIANRIGDVSLIDLANGFKIVYTISHKLIHGNSISFIDVYKNEIIIGTDKGINIYSNGYIKLLNSKIDLDDNVVITGKILNNYLFLGTLKGCFKINLNGLTDINKSKTSIKITKIRVNNQLYDKQKYQWGFFNSTNLKLPFDRNNVSISFAELGTENKDNSSNRYKLVQFGNEKWSNWSNTNTINFSFIPSGIYKLILETRNLSTGQIRQSRLLKITIDPPFWKTWAFVISAILITAFLLFLIYTARIKSIKEQERSKRNTVKRIAETKMEALQSQMNPHFIFNAMNSIQNFVIDNKTDDALWYIGEFSKLIRQTLEFSSKQTVCLQDEIIYLKRYIELENLRRNTKVSYTIVIAYSIEPHLIEIPPLLIQPIVENVFIHAFDKDSINPKISIEFSIRNGNILCQIIDNGKGIDSNKLEAKKSKGIKLVDERIRLIAETNEKKIEIRPNKNGGTILNMTIPLR
jgi:ligand-binding sensor domain-containing protein